MKMKNCLKSSFGLGLLLMSFMFLVGCIDELTDLAPEEVVLEAHAGADMLLEVEESVTLSGSGTSSDGSSFSYLWYVSSEPVNYTLTEEDASTPTCAAKEKGEYVTEQSNDGYGLFVENDGMLSSFANINPTEINRNYYLYT